MGSLSIWHWLLVIGVGVLLFGGKGKISSVMGDFAKGIKAFKAGMKEPEEEPSNPPAQVTPPQPPAGTTSAPGSPTATAGPQSASIGAAERSREHV
jgi:sec-independent protein translocase protein TatA